MALTSLDDLLQRYDALPADMQKKVAENRTKVIGDRRFKPNIGPQLSAYMSEADILLYGGQAGGGKTMLELGWGVNEADSGIIFRRQRTQTDGLEKEGKKLIGSDARYNGQDLEWTWPSGKTLKLAGMNQADDWIAHAGRERDYMAFDEAGEFLEMQVAQIIAWLRAEPGKHCRVILGSNPPRAVDGQWMLRWFAPWLDDKFPHPAEPGELRYAVGLMEGDDRYVIHWVDGPGNYEFDGETYTAKSYTFIPASLEDNPYRNTVEYRATLQSLPEPLRSQLLYGDFGAGVKDQDYQVIPTAWVRAAQARWREDGWRDTMMTAMGLDPAGGGRDSAELAYRHGGWYGPLITAQGEGTKDGAKTASMVVESRRHGCPIVVDVGGGYAGAVIERFKDNSIDYLSFDGGSGSTAKTKQGDLSFANKRAEAWWRFREELDPEQEGGSAIALPPSQELLADLTTPTWTLKASGIQIESKEDIRKRIGRSPGKGDAVVMALAPGHRAVLRAKFGQGGAPKVVRAHANRKRGR